MKNTILFILTFVCCSYCFACNVYQAQINNAERNFKTGNFSKTIEIYESLIEVEQIRDANIYYNLSNAYYRNGNVGKAILNIEKAFKLAPRDKEIAGNKSFLYTLVSYSKEQDVKDIIVRYFTLNEITIITFTLAIFVLLSISLLVIKKSLVTRRIVLLFLSLLIFCALALTLKVYKELILKEAIVLSYSGVRSGPGENNPEIFNISEGKLIRIISKNEYWTNIRFKSNKKYFSGWIISGDIGCLSE